MKSRKIISTIIFIIFLLAGLSLLLYPAIADYISSLNHHKVIENYQAQVDELDEETYNSILAQAREYNEELYKYTTYVATALTEERREIYEQALDVTGTGIMGYIEIKKVNVFLPIYHGTSESVLGMGIGHFEGSSLPVGGENVHTVLSGHSGLTSSKLFTDIGQLKSGDTFAIHVLNEIITYEVDSIVVVDPDALHDLQIEEGMDYCSLTTCTPYGVNSHRMIVHGHRVPTPEKDKTSQSDNKNKIFNTYLWASELLIAPICAVVVVGIVVVIVVVTRRKRRKKQQKEENKE